MADKQYEVKVEPGIYRDGFCVEVYGSDQQFVRVWARDGERAREQVLAMFGGPNRARAYCGRQV
jgi:hypothetical protein